tara:strand:- start:3164 stop:5713 length:2550 start_codon:yes stop_codon:yes gene_type:complete
MKKFKQILNEAKFNHTFTFGRFNPPTIGHEKLIMKVAKTSSGSKDYSIFASQSQSPAKDPLPYALKVAYMRKIFKKHSRNIIADTKIRNVFDIAVRLHGQGYKSITMIAGSDRVKEFERLLNQYNGVEGKKHGYYGFDEIRVISAGERDPDAEGVEGMSASKMRAAATANSFDIFKQGVASDETTARKLFNDVRKYMGIREEKDMGDMDDYETLRDKYLTGKIWLVGEMISANGIDGKIISRGTNYISFNDSSGKVHKAWLTEVRNYRKEYDNYQGTPEQIARRSSRNQARRIMGDKAVQGLDVGHRDNNPLNNDPSNLKMEDPSKNRREPRLREEPKKITKTKQAKGDVADVKGTQPAKYYSKDTEGDEMSKSTKIARARHFAKGGSRDKAPGDKGATTKPSQYTKKYKQMYGEILGKDADMGDYIDDFQKSDAPQFKGKSKEKRKDMAIAAYLDKNEDFTHYPGQVDDKKSKEKGWITGDPTKPIEFNPSYDTDQILDKANKDVEKERGVKQKPYVESVQLDEKIAGLVTKSKQTGVPYGILKKSYDRGMAAWKGGHRPGASQQQWAFARVNSMLTGGKADPDLQKQAKPHKAKKKESYEIGTDEYTNHTKKVTPGQVNEWFENQAVRANYELKYGADWWWKLNEVHDTMLEKVGCCDDCAEVDGFDEESLKSESGPCWSGYKQVGMKMKNGREVPNCVPEETAVDERTTLKKDKKLPNLLIPKKGKAGQTSYSRKKAIRKLAASFTEFKKMNDWGEVEEDAEGKKLNNPTKGDVKKYKVYVKNDKGNVVKVEFGDPNMSIKRDDPERRKAFRARHGCDKDPGPKWKAKYWSCKFWSTKSVTDLMKG